MFLRVYRNNIKNYTIKNIYNVKKKVFIQKNKNK